MAELIASPVSCSIQAHWPFGLISRKYHSPVGVTRKSSAPNRRPSSLIGLLTLHDIGWCLDDLVAQGIVIRSPVHGGGFAVRVDRGREHLPVDGSQPDRVFGPDTALQQVHGACDRFSRLAVQVAAGDRHRVQD